MSTTGNIKMITTSAALIAMGAALAPATAAPQRGDGQRTFGNNGERHFDGDRGRHFGNRSHRNRGFRFTVPGLRIYSGEIGGCGYSYRKWQSTGSRYWRSRYYDCRNG